MMGAFPNAGPHIEFSIEKSKWTEEMFTVPLVTVDGKVAIPDGPGWGVTVSEKWLEKTELAISEV